MLRCATICSSGLGVKHQASRENRGGLGLLIVKRMLELHGGGIRLMDSVSGARFRFFVPCESCRMARAYRPP
jgi:signal transduction histidine kinase